VNCGTFNVFLTESIFKISTAEFSLHIFAYCVQTVFMNLNFVCFIFIVFAQQLGFFLWFGFNLDVQLKSHVISCFLCVRLVQTYVVHTIRVRMPTFPREFTVYTACFFKFCIARFIFGFGWLTLGRLKRRRRWWRCWRWWW